MVAKRIDAVTLNAFAVFNELQTSDRQKIAQAMSSREYKPGNFIISSQDKDRSVYFLISGSVRAGSVTKNGKQIYFEDLSPGMMFGELAALDGGARTSDCIALDDCWVAALSQKDFNQLIDQHPSVARVVLNRLADMVRYQLLRIYEHNNYNVNQRIRFELARLASTGVKNGQSVEITKAPTQEELASRARTHREAVNREIAVLENAGYITWNRTQHVIHDLSRLIQHASEK